MSKPVSVNSGWGMSWREHSGFCFSDFFWRRRKCGICSREELRSMKLFSALRVHRHNQRGPPAFPKSCPSRLLAHTDRWGRRILFEARRSAMGALQLIRTRSDTDFCLALSDSGQTEHRGNSFSPVRNDMICGRTEGLSRFRLWFSIAF